MNGAMLQMLSHGLIAAALFFMAGVTYDRTHTLVIEKLGGVGKLMPKSFALFTAASMASLALPGMSGFVSELTIFLGLATSPVYSAPFKVLVTILAAVGLILTPIYLLSLVRRVFFGQSSTSEQGHAGGWMDAQPREVFIAVSMLVPIIALGVYPKVMMQTYDVKTVAVSAQLQQSVSVVAQSWTERSTAVASTSPDSGEGSGRWLAMPNFRSAIAEGNSLPLIAPKLPS